MTLLLDRTDTLAETALTATDGGELLSIHPEASGRHVALVARGSETLYVVLDPDLGLAEVRRVGDVLLAA